MIRSTKFYIIEFWKKYFILSKQKINSSRALQMVNITTYRRQENGFNKRTCVIGRDSFCYQRNFDFALSNEKDKKKDRSPNYCLILILTENYSLILNQSSLFMSLKILWCHFKFHFFFYEVNLLLLHLLCSDGLQHFEVYVTCTAHCFVETCIP